MKHRKQEGPCTTTSSRTGGGVGDGGARDMGNSHTRPKALDHQDVEEKTSRTNSDETTRPSGAPRRCGAAPATTIGMTCTAGTPVRCGPSCLGPFSGSHTTCWEKARSGAATLNSAPIIDRHPLLFCFDLTENNTPSNGWRELYSSPNRCSYLLYAPFRSV